MAIKLYWIQGINAIDTPVFDNIGEQRSYFESKRIRTINDDSFYPPYYINSIRVDEEDCTLNTRINYLSLEYQGRTFYYFLGPVSYGTDGLLYLNIVMDTVQTYMFDIIFNSYTLRRKSIKRFTSSTNQVINRAYQRENLSQQQMLLKSYEKYSNSIEWIIVQATENIGDSTSPGDNFIFDTGKGTSITHTRSEAKYLQDGTCLYLIPYVRTNEVGTDNIIVYYYDSQGTQYTKVLYDLKDMYVELKKDPRVSGIYRISHIKIDGLSYVINSSVTPHRLDITLGRNKGLHVVKYSHYNPGQVSAMPLIRLLKITILEDVISLSFKTRNGDLFVKSSAIDNPIDPKYVPAMIDPNYVSYEWGERLQTTTIPLDQITLNVELELTSDSDLFTGFRAYSIRAGSLQEDKYMTNIAVQTYEGMTLFNDAWASWIARNKATVTEGWAMNHANNIANGILSMIPTVSNTKNVNASTTSTKGFDTVNKEGFGNIVSTQMSGAGKSVSGGGQLGFAKGLTNIAMSEANEISQENVLMDNLRGTPPTIKSGNSFTFDEVDEGLDRILVVWYVKDYDAVALSIEKQGYLVHEHYWGESLFFSHNIRYYYNVVAADNISFDMNCLVGTDIKNDLHNRFMQGLRLWNLHNGVVDIGQYIYDNVENDNLE